MSYNITNNIMLHMYNKTNLYLQECTLVCKGKIKVKTEDTFLKEKKNVVELSRKTRIQKISRSSF